MVAIKVENLSKKFDIYAKPIYRFNEALCLHRKKLHDDFWALRNISFEVPRGSTYGIIGDNGSGKSTFLRVLAGISPPSEGKIAVNGKISSILDIGAGFNTAFTGRANVYMRCAMMGLSRNETEERFREIVAFSELGPFIEQPVYTYSTGMFMRLGFAIAVTSVPDVLLIDEVLAVGDQYFQRKCIEHIKKIKKKGKAIILASHDLSKVKTFCDQVMWLKSGFVEAAGEPSIVVDKYVDWIREREGVLMKKMEEAEGSFHPLVEEEARKISEANVKWGSGEVRIQGVKIKDGEGNERNLFQTGEKMVVEVAFSTKGPIDSPTFGVAIHRNDGVYCYGPNTRLDNKFRHVWDGEGKYSITYERLSLLPGSYQISIGIYDKEEVLPYDFHYRLYEFKVESALQDHGVLYMDHIWNAEKI